MNKYEEITQGLKDVAGSAYLYTTGFEFNHFTYTEFIAKGNRLFISGEYDKFLGTEAEVRENDPIFESLYWHLLPIIQQYQLSA